MLKIANTHLVGSLTIPLIYVYRNVKNCIALPGKYVALSMRTPPMHGFVALRFLYEMEGC